MKDEFYKYLKNLYWINAQYGVKKYISVFKSAYNSDNDICIWDYNNVLNISDSYDYLFVYQKAYKLDYENELPNLLYQTSNLYETKSILEALTIKDYEVKIEELIRVIDKEKTLSLVDNDGYVKYN